MVVPVLKKSLSNIGKMNRTTRLIPLLIIISAVFVASSAADQIAFRATGAAGDGLLPGNVDPPTGSTGSGDIGATGLVVDTDTNTLFIDVEWGSENGYTDLTGEVTLLHLHGPTEDMAPFNFGQVNTNIIINLGNVPAFDSSGTGGGLVSEFFVSNQEIEWLLSGRTYLNVHTEQNPMGEIRGYLVPINVIPEPGCLMMLVSTAGFALSRRRRSGC